MRISIVGWFGKCNVGDEAFRAFHNVAFDGHDVEFVTPPQTCNKPDIVVLGGGAIISPFYFDILPVGVPVYAIGVGIEYKSEIDLIVQHPFSEMYLRNVTDIDAINAKTSFPVHAIPDLAFYLRPSGNNILPRYKKKNKKIAGIMLTDYVNPAIDRSPEKFLCRANHFHITLADKLDQMVDNGWDIMFIPLSTSGYGDDRRINLDVAAFMKHKQNTIQIFDTLTPQDTIDLLSQLDISICMKFHAHIFSIIAGVKFVSIGFTRKVNLLLQENKLSDRTGAYFEDETLCIEKFDSVMTTTNNDGFNQISQSNYTILKNLIPQVRSKWLQRYA